MSIETQRNEYKEFLNDWKLVCDAEAGSRAVKKAGKKYLPELNPTDVSKANESRNIQYKSRAIFYNATKRTLDTLMGQVFRKPIITELSGRTKAIDGNVDGQGLTLQQQVQKVCRANLLIGRMGLYVDYPQLDQPASLADGVVATINTVDAKSVHNWRTTVVNGTSQLTTVVIFETVQEGDDLDIELIDQYRALRLIDGVYTIEIYRKNDSGEWFIYNTITPRDSTGGTWREIPFIFVGSVNNNPDIDSSPMLDIANINISHYRNSADYEDSVHVCGQPQPWVSGLSEEWRDWLSEQGIYLGSRSALLLPENGSYGIAQAQPNTMAREAMLDKERQMIAIGARLIVKGEAVKTVDQARSENEAQHSILSLVVENVQNAYTKAIGWVGDYMGDDGGSIQINRDFLDAPLDAPMIQALTSSWSAGALPETDIWKVFRKAGIIDPTKNDDQIREELSDISLNLDEE